MMTSRGTGERRTRIRYHREVLDKMQRRVDGWKKEVM